MANEQADRIEAALDRLPADYREVICLSRFAGFSHAEIAAEMGRSELATRSLLSRALSQLAEELETSS
jgi:RNA polymerase sigma-70 factor (ECF subfamily)